MPSPIVFDALPPCTSWSEAEALASAGGEEQLVALAQFRQLLGEDWPGWTEGRHLATQFFLRLQGPQREGARLGRLISQLNGVADVRAVAHELGAASWSSYKHSVMALEVASGLRSRGCEVAFVARTGHATPDMDVQFVDRPVRAELKTLQEPDGEARWHDFTRRLSVLMGGKNLCFDAFDMELEDCATEHPEAVVDGLVRVATEGASEYLPLPNDTGRARLSPTNVGRMAHPGRIRDDLDRVDRSLRGWSKQVGRAGTPALLFVHTMDVYRPVSHWGLYERVATVAARLARHLCDISSVSAVVLYEDEFAPPLSPVRIQHAFFEAWWGTSIHALRRSALFIANPKAAVPLSPGERVKLMEDPAVW